MTVCVRAYSPPNPGRLDVKIGESKAGLLVKLRPILAGISRAQNKPVGSRDPTSIRVLENDRL